MSSSVLEDYLTTIPDARAEPMVRDLDRIIRKAHSSFDVGIKYKILGAYIAEAVRRNPEYLADRESVLDRSRSAAARAGRRPKSTGR